MPFAELARSFLIVLSNFCRNLVIGHFVGHFNADDPLAQPFANVTLCEFALGLARTEDQDGFARREDARSSHRSSDRDATRIACLAGRPLRSPRKIGHVSPCRIQFARSFLRRHRWVAIGRVPIAMRSGAADISTAIKKEATHAICERLLRLESDPGGLLVGSDLDVTLDRRNAFHATRDRNGIVRGTFARNGTAQSDHPAVVRIDVNVNQAH